MLHYFSAPRCDEPEMEIVQLKVNGLQETEPFKYGLMILLI